MNYSSQILSYFSKGVEAGHVLLVAGAPPVEKFGDKIKILFNTLLTPDDIRDTLVTFLSHVRRTSATELGTTGLFSFGMPKMGRFRVHYLTQRGSLMVSILRMPFDIPKLEHQLADSSQLIPAFDLVDRPGGGVVIITGYEPILPMEVAYGLLAHVNQVRSTVICICEQNLSFSLRHHNSVVVQIELGTDVESLSAALESSEFLRPGILYVRNCRSHADFVSMVNVAEAGTLVVLSLVSHSEQELYDDLRVRMKTDFGLLESQLRAIVGVSMNEEGKLRLSFGHKHSGGVSAL